MRRLVPLALGAALALAGCASSPRAEGTGRDVDRRLVELERQAMRQRLELERLARRLAELESHAAAPTAETATRGEPSPAFPPDTLLEPPTPAQPLEETELLERPALPAAGSPLERYEAALQLLRQGETREAETAFQTLLDTGAPADLADNAWFWIGEARLGRGDAAGAVGAYRTAIERFPDGNKIPDALLKLGDALVELGDGDGAQVVWRELVERFPFTASAEVARPRLEPR